MAEETLLLNVEVDQSEAQQQLVATEKSLLSLKNEQKELTKAYKDGLISEDAYVKGNLNIQAALKKEQDQKRTLVKLLDTESNSRNAARIEVSKLNKELGNLNTTTEKGKQRTVEIEKELKHLNNILNEGSLRAGQFKDNIGNYPKSLQQASNITKVFNQTNQQFNTNLSQTNKVINAVSQSITTVSQNLGVAINEIKPAGVSVDGLVASLGKFLTPAGAAVGVLTGLVGLYSQSAAGARDLEFAQNLVSSSISILADNIGEFVAGEGEEQIGFFSRLTGAALAYIDISLAASAATKAAAQQKLRDLELDKSLSQAQSKINERIAEDARRIRDDESKSLSERLAQTQVVDAALNQAGKGVVDVLKQQVKAVIESTTNFAKNKQAQLAVSQIAGEIADKEEEINGKLTENVTARRNILKLIKEEADFEKEVDKANVRTFFGGAELNNGEVTQTGSLQNQEVSAPDTSELNVVASDDKVKEQKQLNDALTAINTKYYEKDLANKEKFDKLKLQAEITTLDSYASLLGSASSLFEQNSAEYKILATFQTLVSTYSAAQKAFESQASIPIVGPELGAIAAAAAIASGLANVAAINGIQFAEGGYTGSGGKYEPAGIVHKGEYVAPQHVVSSVQARPHIQALETMRTRGYADGGFVTNESTAPTQMAMITANALKKMPQPVVGVVQFAKVAHEVQVKQSISKL